MPLYQIRKCSRDIPFRTTTKILLHRFNRKKITRQNLRRRPCNDDINPYECFMEFMSRQRDCRAPWEEYLDILAHLGQCQSDEQTIEEMHKMRDVASLTGEEFHAVTGCPVRCTSFSFSMDVMNERCVIFSMILTKKI